MALNSYAKQILPDFIEKIQKLMLLRKRMNLEKNFYCSNRNKCSTEQVVKDYYTNNGYKVMRAEYSFWKGMFVLIFLDELYPHTLNKKSANKLFDIENSNISTEEFNNKLKLIRKNDVRQFINKQIAKHEQGSYIRWLDEWEIEGFNNPTEYFKSQLVQEFLGEINGKTFYKIIEHILVLEGRNPAGTPDYIVWNDKEMVFVEVKRNNEKLSPEQIEWGKYLIKNKIILFYDTVQYDRITKKDSFYLQK